MEELKENKIKQLKKIGKAKTKKVEQEEIKRKTKYTGLYFVLPSLIGVAIFTLLPFLGVFIRSSKVQFQGNSQEYKTMLKCSIMQLLS